MPHPFLLAAAVPPTGLPWLGTAVLIVGIVLLAVALLVQGERVAALRRELEALRQPPPSPTPVAAGQHERPRFGALYEEPEPSVLSRLGEAVRAEPVRVAASVGTIGTIVGLLLLGGTSRAPMAAVSPAELAQLRTAHDSLRTALAVIASGSASSATVAAAPAAASPPPVQTATAPSAAERAAPRSVAPAAARRSAPKSAMAARPAPRSPVPSAAILPPPPSLGASSALPPAPLPVAPAPIGSEPPPKP